MNVTPKKVRNFIVVTAAALSLASLLLILYLDNVHCMWVQTKQKEEVL